MFSSPVLSYVTFASAQNGIFCNFAVKILVFGGDSGSSVYKQIVKKN